MDIAVKEKGEPMARYIDADKLMKSMYHRAFETDGDTMWQSGCWVRYRAIEQTVKEQPTADVRENVSGEWSLVTDRYGVNGEYVWKCSACSEMTICKGDFCPNCGSYNGGKKDVDE